MRNFNLCIVLWLLICLGFVTTHQQGQINKLERAVTVLERDLAFAGFYVQGGTSSCGYVLSWHHSSLNILSEVCQDTNRLHSNWMR